MGSYKDRISLLPHQGSIRHRIGRIMPR